MDDKEKVDAYISLYKQQMQHFEKNSDIEWKGNFGIWTLLAAGIYFASQRSVPVTPLVSGVGLFSLVLLHGLWLRRMHESETFDKKLFSRYRAEARRLLLEAKAEADPLQGDEREFGGRDWTGRMLSLVLGVAITAGLALLLWFIVVQGSRNLRGETPQAALVLEQNPPNTVEPAPNSDAITTSPLSATKHFMELTFTFVAFFGVVLIAYGTVAAYLRNPWPPIDKLAGWMSAALTLASTAVVALSAYFPVHARPPDPVTLAFFAPAIVVLVLGAVAYMLWKAKVLPTVVTNGFAILALAASILRLLPFSSGA